MLYIPSFWFHYICSLDYSIQCNTRSGSPPQQQGQQKIDACLKGGSQEEDKARVARFVERVGAHGDNAHRDAGHPPDEAEAAEAAEA